MEYKREILQGNITCGAWVNQKQEHGIQIKIKDSTSALIVASIEMTMEHFAEMITGTGMVPMEYELCRSENIGKKLEVFDVKIDLPTKRNSVFEKGVQEELDVELAKLQDNAGWFRIYGWDSINLRNIDRDGHITVNAKLRRWVPIDDTKI